MIRFTATNQAHIDSGIKILVHAPAGAGKTTLCATTGGNPIIVSAESGLLSIRSHSIAVIEVSSFADVQDSYRFLTEATEAKAFDWVCVDSISEIAEVCLANEKKLHRDPRAAFGALQDQMFGLIRAFRDLPGRNVYMSSKQQRIADDLSGIQLYGPGLPGTKLGQGISYFFDIVCALRVEKNADGQPTRWLQTGRDIQYEAKDRSGCLDMFEPPNLAAIATKIRKHTTTHSVAAADSAA
jgi:hypothetical protein